jgi:pyruvate dehydrogenase E1 component
MKLYANQIRPSVPNRYSVLGTDGFGRSDYRRTLRSFFEIDRHFVTISALKALADENKIPSIKVAEAIRKYGIDPEKSNPARS